MSTKTWWKKTDSSSVSIVYLSPFDLYKELWLSGVYILFVLKKNREGWKGSMHIIVNYIRLTWFVCGQFENEKIVVSVYWDVRRDSKFPLSSLSWIIIIRLVIFLRSIREREKSCFFVLGCKEGLKISALLAFLNNNYQVRTWTFSRIFVWEQIFFCKNLFRFL